MKIGTHAQRGQSPAFQDPAQIDDGLTSGDSDLPDIVTFSVIALLPYWLILGIITMIDPTVLPWLGWVGQPLPFLILYIAGFTLPYVWPSRIKLGIYFFAIVAVMALLLVLTILFIGAALGLFVLADQLGWQSRLEDLGVNRFVIILFAIMAAAIASRLIARLHASFLGLSPEDAEAETLRLAHTMAGIFMAATLGMVCLPEIHGPVLEQVKPLAAILALAIAPLAYPISLWFALRHIGFGTSSSPSFGPLIGILLFIWVIGMSTSYVSQLAIGEGIAPFGTLFWPYQAIMMLLRS